MEASPPTERLTVPEGEAVTTEHHILPEELRELELRGVETAERLLAVRDRERRARLTFFSIVAVTAMGLSLLAAVFLGIAFLIFRQVAGV